MSRLLSVFLSLLVLLQSLNISLEDFSKIDDLMEHAKYHQEVYGDNFFDFLIDHYGSEFHKKDSEHKEHKNLPFKHHDCTHSSIFLTQNLEITFRINPEIYFHRPVFFYRESNSVFIKTPIFQPPKLT